MVKTELAQGRGQRCRRDLKANSGGSDRGEDVDLLVPDTGARTGRSPLLAIPPEQAVGTNALPSDDHRLHHSPIEGHYPAQVHLQPGLCRTVRRLPLGVRVAINSPRRAVLLALPGRAGGGTAAAEQVLGVDTAEDLADFPDALHLPG